MAYQKFRIKGLDIEVDTRLLKDKDRVVERDSRIWGVCINTRMEEFEIFIDQIKGSLKGYKPIRFDYSASINPHDLTVCKCESSDRTKVKDEETPVTCLLKVYILEDNQNFTAEKRSGLRKLFIKKEKPMPKEISITCNCLPFGFDPVPLYKWCEKNIPKCKV